jgi:alpha-glucosidase (family GH31 glycosyl hydrolase)
MPLYVRAGAVVPTGPIRQYVDEPVDEPLTFVVYPGADAVSSLYEDDGRSFAYRRGDWMRLSLVWEDAARTLTIRLAPGSRMRPPEERRFGVRVAGGQTTRSIAFRGDPVDVVFRSIVDRGA